MILCCGEALIDMIPASTVSGRTGFVPHNGGAVYNTAIALGRLGVPVGQLTGLSSDMFGQQLDSGLRASHVDTGHMVLSDRPTTLAFVQLVDGHASYSFFDENSAARMLKTDELPALSNDVTVLFFGGISLACEPCADTYADLSAREGASRAVMIDPNIRPGFISDIDAYRQRLERMLAYCDIIKLSDEDLGWLDPSSKGLSEKVEALFQHGPSIVILTRGGQGATGYLRGGAEIHVPAKKVEIADTVGAGDTFNAGVLAKLAEGGVLHKTVLKSLDEKTLKDALEYGARVAAVTVSRVGANPPWASEI